MVVFERVLARLVSVAPGRWLLKGGVALEYRLGYRARTTRDIDLGRNDTEEAAIGDLWAAQAYDAGDYFVFDVRRTEQFDAADDVDGAVRFHIDAELAGRRFDSVILDIGFGDAELFEPARLTPPPLLAFADIRPPEIPVLPVELHVAEKVHAYTRLYQTGPSTRVKDLIDLVLLLETEPFVASRLREALEGTFSVRGTHELPNSFPAPPERWRRPYNQLATDVGLDRDLDAAHHRAALFLDPVLTGEVTDGTWDPSAETWQT